MAKLHYILHYLLWCTLFQAEIAAQIPLPKFEHITAEQGLTSNRINAIVQDHTGFLWIATNNGLNRFDGLETKQYTHQPSDTTSLSDNSALTLFCDSRGQLWVLNLHCLHRYNNKLDNFERFLLSDRKEGYRYENKGMITEDREGNIWIGTPTNGIFFFNSQTNSLQHILPDIKAVSSVFADQSNIIWIGGENGQLSKYDPNTKIITHYKVPGALRRSIVDDFVWKIWQDEPGKINLFLTTGFFRFDIQSLEFTVSKEIDRLVNYTENGLRVLFIDTENMWVGTQGKGLYLIDLKTKETRYLQADSENYNSLINNSITSIMMDQDDVYWVATKDGLCKYDPSLEIFPRYQNEPENPESLHYNFVSSFCQAPDSNVWVGTYGQGIAVFDRKNETFSSISYDPLDPHSLINNTIRALEPDKYGTIWIATINGLTAYNFNSGKFTNYRESNTKGSILSNDILSLLVTRDNRLFVGTHGKGVSMGNIDSINSQGFKTCCPDFQLLRTGKVRKMYELSNGTIIFGTLGDGLDFLYNEKIVNILPSEFSKSAQSDYINALCEDHEKNIWIGTWDGLFILDSTLTFRAHYNVINGLPSSEITGILIDNSGEIWVSGMNGLSKISKNPEGKYSIINYTTRNGLQGSYFTAYSTLKTSEGELYFGGQNGFNRFFPESIKQNLKAPEVKFTDFQIFNVTVPINQKINGRILLTENITETKKITLNFYHKVIGFRFAAMTTSKNDKVRYAAKMEGIDPDWVYLNYNQRYISYNNLVPGDYTLTVKASNADGVWADEGTSISITALPPFWKTWWAFATYILILASIIYWIIDFSLMRTRLKNQALVERIQREKDAEINNLKIKFFINITHEFRTRLSLIVSPLEKILQGSNLNHELKRHLKITQANTLRLLNLNNQLLDFRKIETGNIHLNVAPYDIIEFIKRIKEIFLENTSRQNIKFFIESNVKKLKVWFDPDSMEKILFNLLSNAFKFTPAFGIIKITVNHLPDDEKFEIIVYNTGKGIEPDKLSKLFDRFYQVDTKGYGGSDTLGWGIGLSIVKSLVTMHEGEVTVSSVPDENTQFKIILKTGIKHLENNKNITITENSIPYLKDHRHFLNTETEDVNIIQSAELPGNSKSKKDARILIVEDNPEIRYYLKISLQPNYEILEAANGKIAQDIALQQIPDLIITDLIMPEMNGIELCQNIKNKDLTKHIPIIILSAKGRMEDMLEGLETGADDYVPKPFNEKILLAKIQTLLINRQKLIEKFSEQYSKNSKETEDEWLHYDDLFVNRVIEYIHDNLSDYSLDNEKIEDHFNTSKMQLYRKLKAVTGMSVNSMIKEMRIKRAKKLLKSSEKNISEIAYDLGFSDPLYFSKFFKKEVGIAPKIFRENI